MVISSLDFDNNPLSGVIPFQQATLRLHPKDNIVVAKTSLQAGLELVRGSGERCTIPQFIPAGHKLALSNISTGTAIYRYGQVIGFARKAILAGSHVHTHNVAVKDFERNVVFGSAVKPTQYVPETETRTFWGYRRENEKVGTRNYIAVISTVNCSAHVCQEIARHFTDEVLAAYPNIDGVIALTHYGGCAGPNRGTRDYAILQRTLAGMATHPNVGASLLVGLGCESNELDKLIEEQNLGSANESISHLSKFLIQEQGGTRKTIQAGISTIEELLPILNAEQRTRQPISKLKLALECGGSDSWSGITANPLVGLTVDEIVRQGGTAVIGETPEIFGAEHLLTQRAVTSKVAQKLVDKLQWWQEYLERNGVEFDFNPTPGNKAGGLTNIVEKSLGAIAKGGSTNLVDVYDYAEVIESKGFVVMDTPGYDPVSVTGMVAGGCNLVLFTTGRGSVFGFKPAPSIKICTNSVTYMRMEDDMDVNAGRVLEDGVSMESISAELLDLIIAVASGQPSKSEQLNIGTEEFVPWQSGAML